METRKPVVLIVDDEEPTRRILKLNLQDRYQVLLARNGEEALQQLSQTPVDVLVTDMRMPGLSGLDLLKQVHERWPDLPVIVVTAYGTIENAVEAMRQGAYDYLQKPIKIAELEVLLEKTLRYRRTLDEN
ncbi:MAG TPA: response regulator, partial [Bacteroidetes bacterium]|nr:response regulator [Bacteroidota bacterium]